MAGQLQDERHSELRHRLRGIAGNIANGDVAAAGGLQIHIIGARGSNDDQLKIRCRRGTKERPGKSDFIDDDSLAPFDPLGHLRGVGEPINSRIPTEREALQRKISERVGVQENHAEGVSAHLFYFPCRSAFLASSQRASISSSELSANVLAFSRSLVSI